MSEIPKPFQEVLSLKRIKMIKEACQAFLEGEIEYSNELMNFCYLPNITSTGQALKGIEKVAEYMARYHS